MTSRHIPTNPKTRKILRSRVILLAITISAAAIFILTIIYILYNLWDTLFHRSRTSPFDSSTPLKLQKFSYKELKSATNGFNPDHSIGKGGSGTVFRGVLRNGKSVAIKRLDQQADREFQSELSILGAIRSPHIVSLLGYCIEKNKRVLVYEYMPNRSLQDYLFSDVGGGNVNWEIRFQIIQDVARALEFLHNECDPPVIHGDIKPSNVLLDWDFRAKISDFGLSRVKVEDEFGVEMFSQEMGRSQDLWKSQDLSGNLLNNVETPPTVGTPIEGQAQGSDIHGGGEVDFALALQASTSSKNNRALHNVHNLNGTSSKASPKGKEVLVEDGIGSYDNELYSVGHSKELELNPSQFGKDWWWRQEDSGELSSKDYVTEWIGCQICPSTNPDWEKVVNSSIESNLHNSPQLDHSKEGRVCPQGGFQLIFPNQKGFDHKESKEKKIQKSKPRKMQDWWKEEELDEEKNKRGSKRKTLEWKMKRTMRMPHFELGRRFHILKRRRKPSERNLTNRSPSHEFSFKRGWSRKHTRSMGSEMSGDLFSRELSSTTSMRGTLCYVAPEYGGGCGYLMEKGDIYSLGVLILVIVSGRRPLHVLNSPMKLEKANLISWCRHLVAQGGNVFELVDERLKDGYNKEQATLCIHLALACLQRMPELRPDIGDIVRILRGEIELPPLPFEFSPSPPSKFYSRSRRKQKTAAE